MISRIQQLEPHIANQIAAGEVVERPAAVVKELLENSIDSGATRIDVDIQNGGVNLIRIRDNGCGILKDDLPLAISSHATSKIHKLDDLNTLTSLGFRGEALASISSVSRLSITSCVEKEAWQLKAAGNDSFTISPAAHPQGTTIEVADLFFNAPVRRKFLRTEKTEFSHIEDITRRIALSHPSIAITLKHGERTVFSALASHDSTAEKKRTAKLCGLQFSEQSIYVDAEVQGLRLSGWITSTHASRAYADLQYFFLNQRTMRDKLLNHAVRAAGHGLIPAGRYLGYILHLECDPSTVDINVHPTKHEVRFHDNRLIHDFVHRSLEKVLAQVPEKIVETIPQAATLSPKTSIDYLQSLPLARLETHVQESSAMYAPTKTIDLNHEFGSALACLQQKFILAENDNELIIVDLKQARQLIYQHQFERALRDEETLVSQPLLIPEMVELSEYAIDQLCEQQATLERFGIHFQRILTTRISLRQLPSHLKNAPPATLFDNLTRQKCEHWPKLLAKLAADHLFNTDKKEEWQHWLDSLAALVKQGIPVEKAYRKLPLDTLLKK